MNSEAIKLWLCITLLPLLSQPAWGGWTLVQSAFNSDSASGKSLSLSVSPTGSGNTLIVGIMGNSVGVSVSSITDNSAGLANSYDPLNVRAISSAANTFTELWCAGGSSPGATSVTVQYSGSTPFRGIGLWEVAGLDHCRTDGTAITNDGAPSLTPFGPAIETISDGAFVVSIINVAESITGIHSGNAFTNDSTSVGGGWAHLTSNTAVSGTFQAQWNQDALGAFAASTVAIGMPIVIPPLPGPSGVFGLSSWWQSVDRAGDYSNIEAQCYKPANLAVTGGNLVITSRQESLQCGDITHAKSTFDYTSGMIFWKTLNITYGTIEVRAQFAGGTGPWPAIWLLGADCQSTVNSTADNINSCQWPVAGSDEIDLAEGLGSDLTHINQQIHTGGVAGQSPLFNDGCYVSTANIAAGYHVYQMIWAPGSLVWKIDGFVTCTVSNHVPSTPMMLIINTAVGGAGGAIVNSTLPQTFLIDYVKVIQNGQQIFFDDFIPRPRAQLTSD